MKISAVCFLAVLASATINELNQKLQHPIVKVIKLVEGLEAQALAEGEAEGLAYEKYVYQSGVNKATLTKAIDKEDTLIDSLSDSIDAKTKLIDALSDEIEALNEEYSQNEGSLSEQKSARKSQNDLYKKKSSDLKLTIDAIGQALVALQGAEKETESSLMQKKLKVQKAMSLIQLSGTQLPSGDLAAHVDKYDFKSESVIELFKKLEEEFKAELLETETGETDSLNSYALSKKSLDNMQTAVDKSRNAKIAARTAAEKELNSDKAEKKATEADKKADTATLDSVKKASQTKKEEWEARSKTREAEVAAMDVAVKILSKATGVQTKPPANPVPPTSPLALLQVATAPEGDSRSQAVSRAVNLLLTTAETEHSRMLKQIAVEVRAKLSAPYDSYVFQPVINMIEKMIFQLQKEQKAEDDHKNWCDKEIEKTETMQSDKSDKIKMMKAKRQEEKAKILVLASAIKESNAMVNKIKKFQAEATEIRAAGAKENKLALKDAQDAQAALSDAIAVLTQFYKSSGMIEKKSYESLVQEPVSLPKDPATWDSEYTGVADPKEQPKGIIAVLEEVSKDFAAMEADTVSQEAEDQKAYDEEMSKLDIEKARRTKDLEEKELEKSHRSSVVAELESELKHTGGELKQTTQYMTDLQKACVKADSTYADRKAARAKEEQGLRDAEKILNDAYKPSFLQVRRH
mmetsp:Transcript_16324/g.30107  ORF Transcript_16324/g.30107 Transcript_16324/m.30107 type:complete len:691 (+) Transcript_16324:51-2123(+)